MKLWLLAGVWTAMGLWLFIDGYRNPKPGTQPQIVVLFVASALWPLVWFFTAGILFLVGVWNVFYTPYITWKLRRDSNPKRRRRK